MLDKFPYKSLYATCQKTSKGECSLYIFISKCTFRCQSALPFFCSSTPSSNIQSFYFFSEPCVIFLAYNRTLNSFLFAKYRQNIEWKRLTCDFFSCENSNNVEIKEGECYGDLFKKVKIMGPVHALLR